MNTQQLINLGFREKDGVYRIYITQPTGIMCCISHDTRTIDYKYQFTLGTHTIALYPSRIEEIESLIKLLTF